MPISMRLKSRLEKTSWIRRMFEEGQRLRERHGDSRVVDLSLGNPEVDPPPAFREALARAVADGAPGRHRYMPNVGLPQARAAVAAHLGAQSGLELDAADIVMVSGAASGLNVVLMTLLDAGDEVVLLPPCFPEYVNYLDHLGARPRMAPTRADFSLDLRAIAEALGPRTRAVLINSPNNPTGRVYTRAEVDALAALLRERAPDCYLISDEPYRSLVFEGYAFAGILEAYERAIVVGSHSKDLAIPGERIGYVAYSSRMAEAERRELVEAASFAMRALGFVNAPALMQRVVAGLQGVSVDAAFYQRRRDVLVGGLRRAGYDVVEPGGAFYLFLRTPMPDDVSFVRELADRLVLTVPGTGFGRSGHVRIAFCVDVERIERALPAFAELAELHGLKRQAPAAPGAAAAPGAG